tara:strand:+ start:279 stop:611 length:333 start_codon:yes stop_codon:yes gene_type:complete
MLLPLWNNLQNAQASNWQTWHSNPWALRELLEPEEIAQVEELAASAVQASASVNRGGEQLLAAMEAREAFDGLLREVLKQEYKAEFVAEMWEQEIKRVRRNRATALLLLH